MPEAAPLVTVRLDLQVAWLTIDNPPANALSAAVLEALGSELDTLAHDQDARVLVITGAGSQFFSAGADLKGALALDLPAYLAAGQDILSRLAAFSRPTIAMLQGTALGGGLELAMACDIRLAAEGVSLGQPETNLGIIPGWGGTQRLARLVGRSRALEMIMTGETVSALQAESFGLVNRTLPADALVAYTRNLAGRLSRQPPIALAEAKAALDHGLKEGLAAGLAAERAAMLRVIGSDDAREGLLAFLEKRRPRFHGR